MKNLKRVLALLAAILMMVSFMTACGTGQEKAEDNNAAQTTTSDDNGFLLGSWFVENVVMDGQEIPESDFFHGTYSMYFSDNGECSMYIDSNYAIVKWELTDTGVTLTGDDTYEFTFTDENKNKMLWEFNGAEITMYKYEE